MITKVAAGIVGIGLLGTGSVALAKPGWFGISSQPHFTSLEEDYDYNTKSNSNGEYHGKFGSTHSKNLVGVYGKEANRDGNKAWWEWSFKKLQEDEVTEGNFAVKAASGTGAVNIKVTKPYAKDGDTEKEKALNQVCYAVYKSDKSKITEAGDSAKGEYKESDVWKYCSRLGKKPETQNNS